METHRTKIVFYSISKKNSNWTIIFSSFENQSSKFTVLMFIAFHKNLHSNCTWQVSKAINYTYTNCTYKLHLAKIKTKNLFWNFSQNILKVWFKNVDVVKEWKNVSMNIMKKLIMLSSERQVYYLLHSQLRSFRHSNRQTIKHKLRHTLDIYSDTTSHILRHILAI